jgi:hypothetical protein
MGRPFILKPKWSAVLQMNEMRRNKSFICGY